METITHTHKHTHADTLLRTLFFKPNTLSRTSFHAVLDSSITPFELAACDSTTGTNSV